MIVDQPLFTKALLDPEQAVPDGLIDPKGRPAGKRFNVYRNNVVSSLIDAMETAFPAVHKLVGSQFFAAMAGVYVRAHPPKTPMLMFYGDTFPEFLTGFDPVAHIPYLPDVARLELARRQSYHAADMPAMDPGLLSTLSAEALMETKFDFADAVILLASDYPIQEIWHYNMVDDSISLSGDAQTVLLTRPELDVVAHIIPPETGEFIKQLMQGQSLGLAAERAETISDGFDLSASLGLLLGQNSLTGLKH